MFGHTSLVGRFVERLPRLRKTDEELAEAHRDRLDDAIRAYRETIADVSSRRAQVEERLDQMSPGDERDRLEAEVARLDDRQCELNQRLDALERMHSEAEFYARRAASEGNREVIAKANDHVDDAVALLDEYEF